MLVPVLLWILRIEINYDAIHIFVDIVQHNRSRISLILHTDHVGTSACCLSVYQGCGTEENVLYPVAR